MFKVLAISPDWFLRLDSTSADIRQRECSRSSYFVHRLHTCTRILSYHSAANRSALFTGTEIRKTIDHAGLKKNSNNKIPPLTKKKKKILTLVEHPRQQRLAQQSPGAGCLGEAGRLPQGQDGRATESHGHRLALKNKHS